MQPSGFHNAWHSIQTTLNGKLHLTRALSPSPPKVEDIPTAQWKAEKRARLSVSVFFFAALLYFCIKNSDFPNFPAISGAKFALGLFICRSYTRAIGRAFVGGPQI